MPNCPNPTCNTPGAYVGLSTVECSNSKCIYFCPGLSGGSPAFEPAVFADRPFAEAMILRGVPIDLGVMRARAGSLPSKPKLITERQLDVCEKLVTPEGVVHPTWRRAGKFQRWIASGPNLHVMPHTIMYTLPVQKYYFRAMEIYLYAHLAGIAEIITWYGMGEDIYTKLSTLSASGVDRSSMKEAWWGLIYGLPAHLWKHPQTQAGIAFLRQRYPQIQHLEKQISTQAVVAFLQLEVSKEMDKVGKALHNAGLCVRGVWHDTFWLTDASDEEIRNVMYDNRSYKFQVEEG